MYIDFKITTWERAFIRDEDIPVVEKAIAEGKLRNESDFSNLELDVSWDKLIDVDENITPEENDGFATMEVYNDDNEIIHANGKH